MFFSFVKLTFTAFVKKKFSVFNDYTAVSYIYKINLSLSRYCTQYSLI